MSDTLGSPRPTAPRSSNSPVTNIAALDGLRGIAVILVMATHSVPLLPGGMGVGGHVLRRVLNFGWSGVELFFVLSGFLITRILLVAAESNDRSASLRRFWIRRTLRIFPLYYSALVAILVVQHATTLSIGPRGAEWWWYVGYVQNWLNAGGHIPRGIGHLWSLAIEEQFYLLWPLVIVGMPRRSIGWICVVVVALSAVGRLVLAYDVGATSTWLYHATVVHVDGLAMGALLATQAEGSTVSVHRAGAIVAAGLMAVTALVVASAGAGMWGPVTPYVTSAPMAWSFVYLGVLMLVVCRSSGPLARVLSRPSLRWVGRYSYAIYVVHYPLSVALLWPSVLARLGLPASCATVGCPTWQAMALLTIFVAGSVGLAALTGAFIERPALRWRDRLT